MMTIPSSSENLTTLRAAMITMANKTDNFPLANRCRMVATMLGFEIAGEPDGAANRRRTYPKLLAEIAQIQRDGFYDNPLAHLRGPRNRTTEQA